MGGLASGGRGPGQTALFAGGEAHGTGVAGGGALGQRAARHDRGAGLPTGRRADVVTRAESNVVHELDGQRPAEVLQKLYDNLPDDDQQLMRSSLFLGMVMSHEQEVYRQGDFLIRGTSSASTGRRARSRSGPRLLRTVSCSFISATRRLSRRPRDAARPLRHRRPPAPRRRPDVLLPRPRRRPVRRTEPRHLRLPPRRRPRPPRRLLLLRRDRPRPRPHHVHGYTARSACSGLDEPTIPRTASQGTTVAPSQPQADAGAKLETEFFFSVFGARQGVGGFGDHREAGGLVGVSFFHSSSSSGSSVSS